MVLLVVRFAVPVIVPPLPATGLLLLIVPNAWFWPPRSSVPPLTTTFCTPDTVAVTVTSTVFATPLASSSVPAFTVVAPV